MKQTLTLCFKWGQNWEISFRCWFQSGWGGERWALLQICCDHGQVTSPHCTSPNCWNASSFPYFAQLMLTWKAPWQSFSKLAFKIRFLAPYLATWMSISPTICNMGCLTVNPAWIFYDLTGLTPFPCRVSAVQKTVLQEDDNSHVLRLLLQQRDLEIQGLRRAAQRHPSTRLSFILQELLNKRQRENARCKRWVAGKTWEARAETGQEVAKSHWGTTKRLLRGRGLAGL